MSTPDYPLLTVPGYELYQLAYLTSVAVDALARHRRAAGARDRPADRAPAASAAFTDAVDTSPRPLTKLPNGFPAAAAALPSPGSRPLQDLATKTNRSNTGAQLGRPTRAPSASPSPYTRAP